jgi:CubicO group peptidase (beta-lactamase class C family)
VTKISAPLPALMKLYGEHQLNLDLPFSTYWKDWKSEKDKKQLTLREILAHQAGLKPYIIFLSHAMRKGKFKKRFLRTQKSKRFQQLAYPNIYVKNKFNKYVYKQIRKSEVDTLKKYRYSGLSFLIYPELISQLTGVAYETYLQKDFYQPLGAYTLGFNPENHHFSNALVPTEKDTFFRKTLTHKWVHDENAALLGGVSGNAGLFGSAYDLAKLLQMYLQKGSYGGKQYFSPEAITEFTKIQYAENENRRGLGFDKPLINNHQLNLKEAYPAPEVSAESYGHAGFTGTFVWVDPKEDIVFVFLSNRVYPSRTHRKLYELNIRPALQQVFYRAQIN